MDGHSCTKSMRKDEQRRTNSVRKDGQHHTKSMHKDGQGQAKSMHKDGQFAIATSVKWWLWESQNDLRDAMATEYLVQAFPH